MRVRGANSIMRKRHRRLSRAGYGLTRPVRLVLLCSCIMLTTPGWLYAVQGITGIQAAYDNQTSTNDDYATSGGGSAAFPTATIYNVSFNVGSQNNLEITGFDVGGNTYEYIQLSDRINIERVDNAQASGAKHIILYEEVSVGTPDIDIKASYVATMEESLRSENVNRGSDNVFNNSGDGNGNNNNIERIDYIFADGYPLHDSLNIRGFLVMDRGGNDSFQIAAITNLSATTGKPDAFSTPVLVGSGVWGFSGITINTIVMRGYTESGDEQHPSADVGVQDLDGAFIAWSEFGLQTNDIIYGYSLVSSDVSGDWADVNNPSVYPTTSSGAAGGLDLMSGGAMFFDDSLNARVGNIVWNDYDGDGIQDANEPGITNVLIKLYDSQSNWVAVVRTLADGTYQLRGLAPDTYFVEYTLPTNLPYTFTVQNAGTNDLVDSDAATNNGRTANILLSTGQYNSTIDVGMHLPPSDLAVIKSVDDSTPNEGDSVTFTVLVTNKGDYTANVIELTDVLPSGVTYSGAAPSQGSYVDTNGLWTIGTITNGYSASLAITGTVDTGYGGSLITNIAEITQMDRPDTNTVDNTDSVVLDVQLADLAVYKTVDEWMPAQGSGPIQYTIIVSNAGPDTATNVEVTDILPTGVTYSNSAASSGSYNDGTGIWSLGSSLGAGSKETLWLDVRVDGGTAGDIITNTAAVTASDQADHNPANDSDSAAITVEAADIGVLKTVDNPSPNEGDMIIYTIAITNNGPSATTGVTLKEPLTNGISYAGHSVSTGTYSSISKVWTIGAMALDASETLVITATVDAATSGSLITNRSFITGSSIPDPNGANDADTAVISVSGLKVIKSSDVDIYTAPGSNITYTITVTNVGNTTHTGIIVQDLVPTDTTYVSNSVSVSWLNTNVTQYARDDFGTRAYTNNDGNIDWINDWQEEGETNGALTGGAQVTDGSEAQLANNCALKRSLDLSGAVSASLSFFYRESTAYASNSARDQFTTAAYTNNDGTVDWGNDWQESGEADGAGTGDLLVGGGLLRVSNDKYIDRAVDLSEALNATLSFTYNASEGDEVRNVRDEFTTFAATNNDGNANWAGDWVEIGEGNGFGTGDIRMGNVGGSGRLRIRDNQNGGEGASREVDLDGYTNAILSFIYQRFNNSGSSGTVTLSVSTNGWVSQADLHVFDAGADMFFVSTNYDITPYISANTEIRFRSSSDNGDDDGIYIDDLDITFRKPLMEADDAAVVQVTSNGSDWDDLLVLNAAHTGPVTTNFNILSYATANTALRFAVTNYEGWGEAFKIDDVRVIYETENLEAGDQMFVEISTNGTDWTQLMTRSDDFGGSYSTNFNILQYAATNTTVRFRVNGYTEPGEYLYFDPVNVTYETISNPGEDGTEPPALATNYTLLPGEALSISFEVTVNDPAEQTAITNSVSVTSDQQAVPVVDTVIDPVINTDLGIFKAVDNASPNENDSIVYTVMVTNHGPEDVTGVEITDALPGSLSYVSNAVTQGSYNDGTGIWSLGDLVVAESATLEITATVDPGTAGDSITNTATITSLEQVDSNPLNDEASAELTVVGVDIALTKTVNEPIPYEEQSIVYTIVVTNEGPSTATGVSVTDQLPSGVTYIAHNVSDGTYTNTTGVWTNFTVPANATATLEITVSVATNTAGTSITNFASVTSVTETDYNPGNETDSAVIAPITAPLTISKSSDVGAYAVPGDEITYTIVVTNQSGSAKTGINISDAAPTGTVYVGGSSFVDGPYITNGFALDDFTNKTFANSYGSIPWSGGWIESEGDGPNTGNQLLLFDGAGGQLVTYSLQFAGGNASMKRAVNLGGYTNAELSFVYRRVSLEAGEYVALEASSTGTGGPWTELDRFQGAANDAGYSSTNYDITSYISTNTAIQFVTTSGTMAADDIVWFDDVQITASKRTTNSIAGGAPPDLATDYMLLPGESMTATFKVKVDTPFDGTQVLNTASVECGGFPPIYDTVIDPVVISRIGDFVWLDENTNGVQDVGETGISNITVELYDAGASLLDTTTTDVNGDYLFSGWTAGTYQVKFIIPSNYNFTAQDQGADDTKDSDADTGTGLTAQFAITAGTNDYSRDAGFVVPPASIGSTVWFDSDADGIFDGGETGIVNVTVDLYDGDTNPVDSATTDSLGDYLFTNIYAGDYFVRFTLPTNYTFSPQNQGIDDSLDSDADTTTGDTETFVLAGSDQFQWDAGMYLPAVITGTAWYDSNSNGLQTAGETNGVSLVQVRLYNGSSNFVAQTTTDADGNYTFDGLLAGSYFVQFTLPSDYVFGPQNVGADDTVDSDPDTGTGRTTIFSILAGVTDDKWDASLYIPESSVGNRVWYDADADGIQDAGETGITNVTVRLLNASLDVLDTTVTDGSGNYAFGGIVPGNYIVEFVTPTNYALGPQDVGADDTVDSDADPATGCSGSFYIGAGTDDTTRDAGMYIPSTIGDFVWYDFNTNGVQDVGEAGVSNVTVKLYNSVSNLLDTTATDGSGAYEFTGLAPAGYFVEFVLPTYYVFSLPGQAGDTQDSDADIGTGKTAIFSIESNTNALDWDAGMYIPESKVGNLVWYDKNLDGIKDGGEPGLTNITVKLYTSATNLQQTTATDSVGAYVFTNVTPGSYFVEFVLPGGNYQFSPVDEGADDTVDSDAGLLDGRSEVFVIGTDTNDFRWDAGMYEPAILGDYVWLDLNTNGIQDVGEPSRPTMTVNLYDSDTNYLETSITDGAGAYAFTNLAEGDYLVEYVLPTNYSFTLQDQGADDTLDSDVNPATGFKSLSLTNGEINTTYDAGMTTPLGIIGDFVWFDTNSNGLQDAESGMSNVTVRLYSGSTQLLDSVVTDATGAYEFRDIVFGEYFLEFVRPSGYAHSPQNEGADDTVDSDANQASGRTEIFYVGPGMNETDIDAGFMLPVAALGISKVSNASGVLEPDDVVKYTITVVNTGSVEQTGVTVKDPLPAGLTYVSDSCVVVGPSVITNTVRDTFSTVAYTNKDGSVDWATDWAELGESTDPSGQDYQVLADVSNYQLRARDDAKGVQRAFNFVGYDSATLSFVYRRESLEAGEYIGLYISSNGLLGTFDNLAQFSGAATDPSYMNASYDISSYISGNMAIRFYSDATGMANDDIVYFDDIKIEAIRSGIVTNAGGAPPDLASGYTLQPGDTLTVTYQATVDKPSVITQVVNTATAVSDTSAPVEDSVEDPVAYADLGIDKNINTDKPGTNEVVWYTIVVTNEGPYRADEIEVTDRWPDEVVFDSWASSQGGYEPNDHVWSLGFLDVSNSATLVLTGIVAVLDNEIDIENFVEITFVDRIDPDDLNNTNFSKATTLVVLSGFRAYRLSDRVLLEWETSAEVNTAGFYLLRSEDGGEFVRVNPGLLTVIPGRSAGGVYRYMDEGARPFRRYEYKLVEVENYGRENVYGPFSVRAVRVPRDMGSITWMGREGDRFRIGERASEARERRLRKRREYVRDRDMIFGKRIRKLRALDRWKKLEPDRRRRK